MTDTPEFRDQPPDEARLTAYDEAHLATYLTLLDADADGADWREAVSIIFGLDPALDPERAKRMHATHLARARWMTTTGYRYLLLKPKQ